MTKLSGTVYCSLFPRTADCLRAVKALDMLGRTVEEQTRDDAPRVDLIGYINALDETPNTTEQALIWRVGLVLEQDAGITLTTEPTAQSLWVFATFNEDDNQAKSLLEIIIQMIENGELKTRYQLFGNDYPFNVEHDCRAQLYDEVGEMRPCLILGFAVVSNHNGIAIDYPEEEEEYATVIEGLDDSPTSDDDWN